MKVRCSTCNKDAEIDANLDKFTCPHCGSQEPYIIVFEFVARPRIITPLLWPSEETHKKLKHLYDWKPASSFDEKDNT